MKRVILVCLIVAHGLHAYDYDLIVIGGGASGLTAAKLANEIEKRVAIIEKAKIGGGRIWSGDIPFKTLFKISDVAHQTKNLHNFGLNLPAMLDVNVGNLVNHVRSMQEKVYNMVRPEILQRKGIDTYFGLPKFMDDHTIQINGQVITADKFYIATGAHSKIPDIKGVSDVGYHTRETFFLQDKMSESMIIIGGGPLGVEMASSLNKLGIKVTLIMKHGYLLPTYDLEMVELLTGIMVEEGVDIRCDMRPIEVKQDGDMTSVCCVDRANQKHEYKAESLFFAAGSAPNVNGLNLEKTGVHYTRVGIPVGDNMQTNIPNIYAGGDVVGLIILSRIAYYHAKTAVYHMFKQDFDDKFVPDYVHVSKVIFTYPQLAAAGMTEEEAFMKYGNNIRVYRYNYDLIEKSYIDHDLTGMAKFIWDNTGELLGIHVLGAQAGDIVDGAYVGKKYYTFFEEHAQKVRTSPSYFDLLQISTNECRKEMQETASEGILNSMVNSLFGWKEHSRFHGAKLRTIKASA